MTTDVAQKAEQKLADFTALLAEYDSDVVEQVHEALEESTIAHIEDANLSVDGWLEFLKTVGTDAYLFAMDTDYTGYGEGSETKWYLRHNGETFIYGTEKTGELYCGEQAERQLEAVIGTHGVIPRPMSEYSLEKREEFGGAA